MSAPQGGASPARSWRGGRRAAAEYDGPSTLARVLWTLLFVGLISLVAWLIYWFLIWPEAQFASLGVVYENAAPIPFCEEDTGAFAALAPRAEEARKNARGKSDLIGGFWEELGGSRSKPLIVYISARGVCDAEGRPWLLCRDHYRDSDWTPGSPQAGRYALHDLLAQSRKSRPAGRLTLLILDVSFTVSNPRAGMMLNSFPALVEKEVKELGDPDLWVLTNSRVLETEHFSEQTGRSVFSYFVVEGLRGKADTFVGEGGQPADRDYLVELDEFYDFVVRGVRAWMRQQYGDAVTQTPCLYHAGGKSGGESVLVAKIPKTITLRHVSGPVPPVGEEQEAERAKAAADKAAEVETLLREAWEQHDKLQPQVAGAWAPLDYAPHLWGDYEDLLLDYEFRLRSGAAHEKVKVYLKLLVDTCARQAPRDEGRLAQRDEYSALRPIRRLVEARRLFQERHAEFQAWSKDEPAFCKAFQARNRGVHLAVWGLRWHEALIGCNLQADTEYRARVDLLRRLLTRLQELARKLDEHTADPSGRNPRSLQTLDQLAGDVDGAAGELRERWLAEARRAVDTKLVAADRIAGLDALLATPVLPARLRVDLLGKRRRDLDVPLTVPDKLPAVAYPQNSFEPSGQVAAQLAVQAELEREAALLANPAAKIELPQLRNPAAGEIRDKYLAFGKQILEAQGKYRRKLDDEAKNFSDSAAASAVDSRTIARLDPVLRWGDPHDIDFLPPPSVKIAGKSAVTLALSPTSLDFKEPKPQNLVLTVGLSGNDIGKVATAEIAWNQEGKSGATPPVVKRAGEPLPAGQWEKVSLVDSGGLKSALCTLTVDPGKLAGPGDCTLKIVARAAGARAEGLVAVRLPRPNRAWLIVRGPGSTENKAANDARPADEILPPIVLRPFANRQTTFDFRIANHSEVEKEFSVDFLAPGDEESARRLNQWLRERRPGLPDGISVLRSPIPPLKIKPDGEQAIAFSGPPPAAKPDDKSAPPAKPASVDVTAGFMLVVRDAADPGRWLLQRYVFRPLKPSDFLALDREGTAYDANREELRVRLKAKEGEPFPDVNSDNPIRLDFFTTPKSPQIEKKIESASAACEIVAPVKLNRSTDTLRFSVDVDGYPHGLQFISGNGKDFEEDDTFDVQIEAPETNEKVFSVAGGTLNAIDATRVGAAWPRPATSAPVLVPLAFRVAAYTDFLQDPPDKRSRIEVKAFDLDRQKYLPDNPSPKVLVSRPRKITLEAAGPGGDLKVSTQMKRFEENMPFLRATGRYRLEVAATPNYNPLHKSNFIASRTIILDDLPGMDGNSVTHDSLIEKGKPLAVLMAVDSLGEVRSVFCGFEDQDKPNEFAQDPPKAPARRQRKENRREWWSADLATDKLPPGEQLRPLLVVAENEVGRTVLKLPAHLRVKQPPAPPGDPAKPPEELKGTISGKVVFKFNPNEHCTSGVVYLDDPATGRQSEISDSGSFRFDEVPYGKHKLFADGQKAGTKGRGAADVTLDNDHPRVDVRLGVGPE